MVQSTDKARGPWSFDCIEETEHAGGESASDLELLRGLCPPAIKARRDGLPELPRLRLVQPG
jgi:hypothetical protein